MGRLQKDSENIYIHSNVRTGFSEISSFLCIFTSIPFQTEIHLFFFFSLFLFKCFIFNTDFNLSYMNALIMVTVTWFVFIHLLCVVVCAFSICTYEEQCL